MVLCAYAIEKNKEKELTQMGVKDSKLLSPKRRESLYPKIEKLSAQITVKHLSAAEIDEMRKRFTLNVIEQKLMIKLIKDMKTTPSEIYIDAADVNAERYGEAFKRAFPKSKIVSKHQADKFYPVVSAASVIAKVQRDQVIEKLAKKIGEDIGSGYPADPKTKKFLRTYYAKNKKFPPFVRESWDTAKKLKKEFSHNKISDFMGK
ncbi:MAG: ribonuclease HII [Candidatus Heimdallarchaeota archaeon]|nr:ribonuclease HII [Candidatus Heimdallarchaeota archaeon]